MNQTLAALAIQALGDDAWGGAIYEHILGRSIESISGSAVYLALEDLEKKGYAQSWVEHPRPGQGGRPRKYYKLTDPEGITALKNTLSSLNEVAGVQVVLNPAASDS